MILLLLMDTETFLSLILRLEVNEAAPAQQNRQEERRSSRPP